MISDNQLFGLSEQFLVFDDSGCHKLHPEVTEPFRAMQFACSQVGIGCDLVSGFRSFTKQLSIWERKWSGELPIRDIEGNILETSSLSDKAKVEHILTWSALPGASRHHWGTDIDVYDKASVTRRGQHFNLIHQEYEQDGPCADLSAYLKEHAHTFGFTMPYTEYKGGIGAEPWHLSFDAIASEIASNFSETRYHAFLSDIEFSGRDTVLSNFEEIFYRFVLNKGLDAKVST